MKQGSKRNPAVKVLVAFWIALTILGAFVALSSIPPVSQSKLNRLKHGMSTSEAGAVLGRPRAAIKDSHGGVLWEYNRFGISQQTLTLNFDESGHLVSFVIDY